MGSAKRIKVADRDIKVSELTVKEVEEVIEACADGKVTTLDLLFPDIPSEAIAKSTGVAIEELEQLFPSELQEIVDAVKEVNPFFVSMYERLKVAASDLAQGKKSLETGSEEQSAGS